MIECYLFKISRGAEWLWPKNLIAGQSYPGTFLSCDIFHTVHCQRSCPVPQGHSLSHRISFPDATSDLEGELLGVGVGSGMGMVAESEGPRRGLAQQQEW